MRHAGVPEARAHGQTRRAGPDDNHLRVGRRGNHHLERAPREDSNLDAGFGAPGAAGVEPAAPTFRRATMPRLTLSSPGSGPSR